MIALLFCLALFSPALSRAEVVPPLLSLQEIEKSSLSREEKRLATLTLSIDSVLNCFSAKDLLGGDFERLRIYYLEDGISLAVFKNGRGIRVFQSQEEAGDIQDDFASGNATAFSNVSEGFDNEDLTLAWGKATPGLGKTTLAIMNDPMYESMLVCHIPH